MKIVDLVSVMRSKNAGPFVTTIDLLFKDRESYEKVKKSNLLTAETVVRAYHIPMEQLVAIHFVDPISAVKITMIKPKGQASGEQGCADLFGAQQHIPMYDLELPE
jgi:hypothetical protein